MPRSRADINPFVLLFVSGVFDPAMVEAYVVKRVPGACLVEDMGLELYFQLPSDEIRTGNFTKLFNDLDADLSKLGVSSYGIADTTLEEVSIIYNDFLPT